MCDYSLEHVKSRAAEVGDKLITAKFSNTYTKGFAAVGDPDTAVCLLPGTEIAFDGNIQQEAGFDTFRQTYDFTVGRFVQLKPGEQYTHHDALELPNGTQVLLNNLEVHQTATVLQLPAKPLVSHVELPADCEASEPAPAQAQTPYYVEAV